MAAKRPRVDAEEAPGVEEDAGVGGGGYVFDPAPPASLSIVHRPESCGTQNKIPVHRVYCVGRNYWDHGVEMGGNPEREPPFFFMKPADAVVDVSGVRDEVSFPAATADLHFECEMVLVINTPDGRPVGNVKKESAAKYIYGYAVGIDLTRRDLQKEAKQMRRCWSASKGFDQSAPVGAVTLASDLTKGVGVPPEAVMNLDVNGVSKQRSPVGKMIWDCAEIVAALSQLWDLVPGDIIFTGTPAGVGRLLVGDQVHATVEGLAPCDFTVGKAVAHYNAATVKGTCWPAFGGLCTESRAVALIREMETQLRPTDVWLATFPKCGTTWVHQICLLLLNGGDSSAWASNPHGFGKHEAGLASWPEMQYLREGEAHLRALAQVPDPRIIKTHAPWKLLPGGGFVGGLAQGARAIYVARNPKDACVSMMYHAQRGSFGFDGDWSQWLALWLSGEVEFGSWFEHNLGWWAASQAPEHSGRILWVAYEQLQAECSVTISKIAAFLGVELSDELCAKVQAASSFSAMRKDASARDVKGQGTKGTSAGSASFFRKGEVGDWRNHFSAEESDQFDELYKQRMAGSGLTFDFGGGVNM